MSKAILFMSHVKVLSLPPLFFLSLLIYVSLTNVCQIDYKDMIQEAYKDVVLNAEEKHGRSRIRKKLQPALENLLFPVRKTGGEFSSITSRRSKKYQYSTKFEPNNPNSATVSPIYIMYMAFGLSFRHSSLFSI